MSDGAQRKMSDVPGIYVIVHVCGKAFAYTQWRIQGGYGGCKCTPLWRLAMYFCVHNCTSPLNDYAAVACSSNQAQLHTHVSVPY